MGKGGTKCEDTKQPSEPDSYSVEILKLLDGSLKPTMIHIFRILVEKMDNVQE